VQSDNSATPLVMTPSSPLTIDLPSSAVSPPPPSMKPVGTIAKAIGELAEGDGLERQDNVLLVRSLEQWADGDKKSGLMIYRMIRNKAKEFAGPPPVDPLVASASVHAAACWFELHMRRSNLPINRARHPDVSDLVYERAHKRFLESVRTVANLRKLKVFVQVNIAHGPQQVNLNT
jgi:hypothetical protein